MRRDHPAQAGGPEKGILWDTYLKEGGVWRRAGVIFASPVPLLLETEESKRAESINSSINNFLKYKNIWVRCVII